MKYILLIALAFFTSAALADNAKIIELEKKLQALTEEVIQLKTKEDVPELYKANSFSGMGASASKVYEQKGLSIGGYGELLYSSPRGDGIATSDAYRLVPYIGYNFNDKIVFNSEIEFEHGGAIPTTSSNTDSNGDTIDDKTITGEVVIEFAYLDFLFSPKYSLRAGHILVPLGRINLKHEPINFYSANRPEIEKNIIPSTWHENGLMLFGEHKSLSYKIGVVNSFDLSGDNAKNSSWLRSARQKGARAKSEDLSYFARLDYSFKGNTAGVSYYTGNSTHDTAGRGDGTVQIFEAHLDYKYKDFILNALYVNGSVSDTDLIAASNGVLGSDVEGYYLTLAYDLKTLFKMNQSIIPFVRYSEYDLHKEVATGQTKDNTLSKQRTTFGVSYFPDPQVVIKADYQMKENDEGNEADIFNLALGFVF